MTSNDPVHESLILGPHAGHGFVEEFNISFDRLCCLGPACNVVEAVSHVSREFGLDAKEG